VLIQPDIYRFLRTFGERGASSLERWQESLRRGIKDALFQEVKFSSAEHLSLEQFQAMHVTFDLPITPGQSESAPYSCFILAQAGRKAAQFSALIALEPSGKQLRPSVSEETHELTRLPGRVGDRRRKLLQRSHESTLFPIACSRLLEQPPGSLTRRG
jgi:hypothetical protein